MSVHRCEDCGGLFGQLPRGVCATCLDDREADFRTVRDWLRRNAGASAADVAAATGVRQRRISLFIEEGRLTRPPNQGGADGEDERRRERLRGIAARSVAPPVAAPAERPRGGGMHVRRS